MTWASGARTRIGYEVVGRSWMYTTRVPRPRALRPRHSVVSQWDVLTPLGIAPPDPDIDAPEMPEDAGAAAAVDRRLAQAGVSPKHSLIVVHVSAGNPFRRWPQASFVDVVCQLAGGDAQRRIILTSGPSDEPAASAVAQEARARLSPDRRSAVVSCGEFNLAELRSLVGRAALYIGGDSGPLHVAGTTGVPVVGLYGPTLPVRSQPYRSASFAAAAAEVHDLPCRPCDQRRCVPGDFRCLTGISPDRVAELAEQLLRV
jgi:heptosyltransferase I